MGCPRYRIDCNYEEQSALKRLSCEIESHLGGELMLRTTRTVQAVLLYALPSTILRPSIARSSLSRYFAPYKHFPIEGRACQNSPEFGMCPCYSPHRTFMASQCVDEVVVAL